MKKDKLITMRKMYGGPDDKFGHHIACRECGFCKTCGDCKKYGCAKLK